MAVRSYTRDLETTPRPAPPPAPRNGAVTLDARPAAATPVAQPSSPTPAPPPSAAVLVEPAPSRTPKIQVIEHPLAQQALTVLRDPQTSARYFRQLSNQLLTLLLVESTRGLPARSHAVETASGQHTGAVMARPIILLTLARHGLGLAHNLAELFPDLFIGSISLERGDQGRSVNARIHLANAPALADAEVILFDPVVSTGGTAQAALNLVKRCGATRVSFISLLFSLPGLSHLQASFPDLRIWTAGIDTNLDAKRGPLPGLGDFAARLYGSTGRTHFTSVPWQG